MKRLLLALVLTLSTEALTARANDHTSSYIDARLQKVYNALRATLDAKGKEQLKQDEMRWLAQTESLRGQAANDADLARIDELNKRLQAALGNGAQVQRATPVAQSTPSPNQQVTADNLQAPANQFGTCTLKKGTLLASSAKLRKQAFDLLMQGDEGSLEPMIESGDVILLKQDVTAYFDGTEGDYVKIHFRGAADQPYFAYTSDVTVNIPKQ
jgi:hypothetical protein